MRSGSSCIAPWVNRYSARRTPFAASTALCAMAPSARIALRRGEAARSAATNRGRAADDQPFRLIVGDRGNRSVEPVGGRRSLHRPEGGQPRTEWAVSSRGAGRETFGSDGRIAGQGLRLFVTRSFCFYGFGARAR